MFAWSYKVATCEIIAETVLVCIFWVFSSSISPFYKTKTNSPCVCECVWEKEIACHMLCRLMTCKSLSFFNFSSCLAIILSFSSYCCNTIILVAIEQKHFEMFIIIWNWKSTVSTEIIIMHMLYCSVRQFVGLGDTHCLIKNLLLPWFCASLLLYWNCMNTVKHING